MNLVGLLNGFLSLIEYVLQARHLLRVQANLFLPFAPGQVRSSQVFNGNVGL